MDPLAELRAIVEDCPREDLPDLAGELARAQALLQLRLQANGTEAPEPRDREPDSYLTAEAVAARLSVSDRWVYDHAAELRAVKLSGRAVRFSERAVERFLRARRA